jgi:hypothetical protein
MGTNDAGGGTTVREASRGRIQWLQVVLGGMAVEAGLFVIAIAFYFLPNGSAALLYVVPVACLCTTLVLGFWVARRAQGLFILHGTLVGIVAASIYLALTWGRTLPTAYIVSHFLKVIGGAFGGLIAMLRQSEK